MKTQLQAITDHNEQVAPEFMLLTEGMSVSNHTIIACTRQSERVIGETYASWVVLAETETKSFHKWVTWVVMATEKGFQAQWGHYFAEESWEEAVGRYKNRGGRY